ncbi:TRAP transporter substrate-binding protein [Caenimonas terrae]|uniref:TRAP transporter substrate-binding protein n=1 Tax=Caenimonas terrae TaxID=696074 RepID=A0ABW0N710_9BURK
MRTPFLSSVAGVVMGLAALLPLAGQAQDIKERTLKFTFSIAKDHPLGQGAYIFADLVKKKSGGKIKVDVFPAGVLGGAPQDLAGLRGGTIDFSSMATGLLSGIDKEFMVFDFPFLFNNPQEAFAVADGPVGTRLMGKLPQHGLVGLGMWDLGFRNMTNSRHPIARVEDLQGLKVRVIGSPIYLDLFNALGANPLPMAFPEVYGALESKAVDGQENPLAVIETSKFNEVQKYLSLTRHVYTAMPVLMSKKTWDGMSPTERKIIVDSEQEARTQQRQISLREESKTLAALQKLMQVNQVSPAEMQRLRQKVQPVVDKYTREVGEPVVREVNAELAKLRAAK